MLLCVVQRLPVQSAAVYFEKRFIAEMIVSKKVATCQT
jgi:hypothetical protein